MEMRQKTMLFIVSFHVAFHCQIVLVLFVQHSKIYIWITRFQTVFLLFCNPWCCPVLGSHKSLSKPRSTNAHKSGGWLGMVLWSVVFLGGNEDLSGILQLRSLPPLQVLQTLQLRPGWQVKNRGSQQGDFGAWALTNDFQFKKKQVHDGVAQMRHTAGGRDKPLANTTGPIQRHQTAMGNCQEARKSTS